MKSVDVGKGLSSGQATEAYTSQTRGGLATETRKRKIMVFICVLLGFIVKLINLF